MRLSRTGSTGFRIASLLLAGCATLSMSTISQAAEYIVKLKSQQAVSTFAAQKSILGAQIVDQHQVGQLLKISLPDHKDKATTAKRLHAIMTNPAVEYVVENFNLYALGSVPNDPQYGEQWALLKVNAEKAWAINKGSEKVTIGVIDTGVDYKHEDLAANIWTNPNEIAGNGIDDDNNGYVDDVHGYDFLDNDADPQDATSDKNPGHGTHCAGIIAAVGDNAKGISGLAQKASIVPLRFLGPTGQGDLMAAIKAIDYAIAMKFDIISASWGAKVPAAQAKPLIEAVGRTTAANITFVVAAANNGENNDTAPMYPANAPFENVIAVAASDINDEKPQWSNYGKSKVAVAAPGHEILSTLPGNKTAKLSGTSMATPLVAGAVALLKSQNPNLKPTELKALLQASGTKVNIETACNCRIDAGQALDAVTNNQLLAVPTAASFRVGDTGKVTGFGGTAPYQFTSGNDSILTVAADGSLTAKTVGTTNVTIKDSTGLQTTSLNYHVLEAKGEAADCPLQDPNMCMLMCMLDPTLPWCQE